MEPLNELWKAWPEACTIPLLCSSNKDATAQLKRQQKGLVQSSVSGIAQNVTMQKRVPFLVIGASNGASFIGFNHSVALTVTGAKRFLPCLQLFKSRGATTAAAILNADDNGIFLSFTAAQYRL